MTRARERGARIVAVAVCLAVVLVPAAPARAAAGRVLTLRARDSRGRPVAALHEGETLVLDGTLTAATPGEPVSITLTPEGRPPLARSTRIRAVDAAGTGSFGLSLHMLPSGRLTIVAQAGEAASAPVALDVRTVGRRQAGCQGPARLVRLHDSRPPRVRDGRLRRGALLETGARVRVPKGATIGLRRGSAAYRVLGGRFAVECGALEILRGRVRARSVDGGKARVLVGRGLAEVGRGGEVLVDARPRRMRFVRGPGVATSSADPRSVIRTVADDTVLEDGRGLLRLNTWPFPKSPDQRRPRPGAVPPYWADGSPCAVGCRPAGALTGWPLKPFHRQHPLRAGLNEWRPANMHIGVDIQTRDGTPVYAVQSGFASIAGVGTSDIRVAVGSYEYWHVRPAVHGGQWIRAHHTVIGHVIRFAGHLHLSEVRGGYLNPLRPGGTVLKPYRDTEEPVIGSPVRSGGQVFVQAFDPQSLRETVEYRTPVLAPAAVAWRARDARGRAITGLHFSYRGSHHYPTSAKSVVYGPGTTPPTRPGAIAGWGCFARFKVCVPKWNYRLFGVPSGASDLSVYAWDWAGNVAVRTSPLRAARASAPLAGAMTAPEPGPTNISPVD